MNLKQLYKSAISSREEEVLQLIADEHTTKEIAAMLYISDHTVISHRKSLMEKMGAKNTAGLVRRGFEKGVLQVRVYFLICFLMIGGLGLSGQGASSIGLEVGSRHNVLFGDSITGEGNKLMWISTKGAMRAGGIHLNPNAWNIDSIGFHSVAFGVDNIAGAQVSSAFGQDNKVQGALGMSWGTSNFINGSIGTAWGSRNVIDDGFYSTAWGNSNRVEGVLNSVWGAHNISKGDNSTVWGQENKVDNSNAIASTVWGSVNTVTGSFTTSWGTGNTLKGQNASGWGIANRVDSIDAIASTVWGVQNQTNGSLSTSWGNLNSVIAVGATSWGTNNRIDSTKAIYSTVWGEQNLVNGELATAWGKGNNARGYASTAMGVGLSSRGAGTTVVGQYNHPILKDPELEEDLSTLGSPLFIVGNGDPWGNNSNALTVMDNGRVKIGNGVPKADLHIISSEDSDAEASGGIRIESKDGGYWQIIYSPTNELNFIRDGVRRAYIDVSGGWNQVVPGGFLKEEQALSKYKNASLDLSKIEVGQTKHGSVEINNIELLKNLPGLMVRNEEGVPIAIDYKQINLLSLKTIQDQSEKIEQLQNTIDLLIEQLENINTRLIKIEKQN